MVFIFLDRFLKFGDFLQSVVNTAPRRKYLYSFATGLGDILLQFRLGSGLSDIQRQF